jgi:hypothetical protein
MRRAGLLITTLAAVLGDTIYVDVRINSIIGKQKCRTPTETARTSICSFLTSRKEVLDAHNQFSG